ncbi:universal stress protein [Thermodesulfobacterium thermophilum]|uniref:universal stress protein n=1 Tax=Thermodesulfobacterium thermophilum TaxID=886 RepID=UPI00041C48F0|nr:universal stress protein [Thermodesulfobacterium thermophilum]
MVNCGLKKVLLPVDKSENSFRAVKFAGNFLRNFRVENITLFYVMAGGYLSEHMKNLDFRAELIKNSEIITKIKKKHVEENIMPFLSEYEGVLKKAGITGLIEKKLRKEIRGIR